MHDEAERHSETFGDRVRDTRVRLGLSQTELAKIAGIQRSHLSDIERGKHATRPQAPTVKKLADALAVDPIWLRDGDRQDQ